MDDKSLSYKMDSEASNEAADGWHFVSLGNERLQRNWPSPSSRHPNTANDMFLVEQWKKCGTEVFAFLLLSGFGPNAQPIAEFVGRHLLRKIVDSAQLEMLAQRSGTALNSLAQRNEWEEQVGRLLKEAFVETDRQAWDAISVRQFNSGDGRAAQELLESGCCAMVALLIGSRLFVANCGTQMAILCRDGTDGLSALSLSDWHELLARSFGNFGRKMSGHQCTAMPTVQPQIELDHNARFLLLASPSVWRLFQKVCPANQSVDGAVANAIANAVYGGHGQSAEQSIRALLSQLVAKCPDPASQSISLAFIDLRLDIFPKTDFLAEQCQEEEAEEEEESQQQPPATVKSAVDWSEFETHHLKEEVLAKVDSLRQMYSTRRNLGSIREDS